MKPDRPARPGGFGRSRARLQRFPGPAVAVVLLATFAADVASASAQEAMAAGARDAGTYRTRFSSFDIGFGGVFPVDGDVGISYGVAVDAANLFVKASHLRFAVRFWTSEDAAADGRLVDLDDTSLSLILKKPFGGGGLSGYAGFGLGLHFIAARYQELIEEKEVRQGFRPGLDLLLGIETPLYDRGFISLFAEAIGSVISKVSHGSAHVGFRIRFDRLGTGG